MEFLAFKSLVKEGDSLLSPMQKTKWGYINFLGEFRPALFTSDEDLEKGLGIFAASSGEALEYNGELYLVAPLPDDNEEVNMIVGTTGWRATSAVVIGGPYSEEDTTPHEIILNSYLQGYEQVPGILADSLIILKEFGKFGEIMRGIDEENNVDSLVEFLNSAGDFYEKGLYDLVVEYTKHPLPEVRVAATKAVGKIGGDSMIDVLISMLEDPAYEVREIASLRLCVLGDKGSEDKLLDKLDGNSKVRAHALWVLSKIGVNKRNVSRIVKLLDDSDPTIKYTALGALWYARRHPALVRKVADLLDESYAPLQMRALHFLINSRTKTSDKILRDLYLDCEKWKKLPAECLPELNSYIRS